MLTLREVFDLAVAQAETGKGQRHDNGEGFHNQPWMHYAKMHGRGFLTGQAVKKLEEAASRYSSDRFEQEVLGAIVYAAMSIIIEREVRSPPDKSTPNQSGSTTPRVVYTGVTPLLRPAPMEQAYVDRLEAVRHLLGLHLTMKEYDEFFKGVDLEVIKNLSSSRLSEIRSHILGKRREEDEDARRIREARADRD